MFHLPDEHFFGSFTPDWFHDWAEFYDAKGRRIPRPPVSDMSLFVMEPQLLAEYAHRGQDSQVRNASIGYFMPSYRRLTDATGSDVVSKEAIVRVPTHWEAIINTGGYCFWSSPASASGNHGSTGANQLANVWFNDCWTDPHSTYYSKVGDRIPLRPIDRDTVYTNMPHLTLLYDKRTGKLAGGYWWGEFRPFRLGS